MARPAPTLFVCALLGALGAARAQDDAKRLYAEGVVAVVEGVPITRYELELTCLLRGKDYRDLTPGAAAHQRIQREVLDTLVEEEVLFQRAQAEKVKFTKKDQERLDWEIARIGQERGGVANLKLQLERIGVPFEWWAARQKRNVVIGNLLVRHVSRDIFITPAEVRRHYEQHQARYRRGGEIRLRQVVVHPNPADATVPLTETHRRFISPGGELRHRELAAFARARILKGEPFQRVAQECSMIARGASEDWVLEAQRLGEVLKPPLDATVSALKPGQVSEVVEGGGGTLYVLLLVDRREPGVLPLEEVQREIEGALREQRYRQLLKAWIARARAEAQVETFLPSAQK